MYHKGVSFSPEMISMAVGTGVAAGAHMANKGAVNYK